MLAVLRDHPREDLQFFLLHDVCALWICVFCGMFISRSVGDKVEKQLLRYGNLQVAALVFFLYYGVPLLTVETGPEADLGNFQDAGPFFKRLLFPISYVGMGQKMSKWGMGEAVRDCSVGALVVLWSAQVTVGKLFDALDAYFL